MSRNIFACMVTAKTVSVLSQQTDGWRAQPLNGETTLMLDSHHHLADVFDELGERVHTGKALANVELYLFYTRAAAPLLPEAVTHLARLGCNQWEVRRRESLAQHTGLSDADLLNSLYPASAKVAAVPAPVSAPAARTTDGASAPPPAAAVGKAARFWTIETGNDGPALIYDSCNRLLWLGQPVTELPMPWEQAAGMAAQLRVAALSNWRVPAQSELASLAVAPPPLRNSQRQLLSRWNWLCTEGRLDVVKQQLTAAPAVSGHLLAVHDLLLTRSHAEIAEQIDQRRWKVTPLQP